MRVRLAGFNVDLDWLKRITAGKKLKLTPETLSAAYARISRSAKDIPSLRQEACRDVIHARNSNKRIIFSMGHHSMAEHAVFNIDIMNVSRIALEEIEKFRLVSYMEKSQRYVTLKGDSVTPPEIKSLKNRQLFRKTIEAQNRFYQKCFSTLTKRFSAQTPNLAKTPAGKMHFERRAKEDARYILSLATEGQVGMTINARNLEHLFRRFSLSTFQEVQILGKVIFDQIVKVTPSLILFPTPSQFEKEMNARLQPFFTAFPDFPKAGIEPSIVWSTDDGDDLILASLLCGQTGYDFKKAHQAMRQMNPVKKKKIFLTLFQGIEFFDAPPREFELVEVIFQAVTSASCYAQLKRHRMAMLTAGPYDPAWGVTLPESIRDGGLEEKYREIIQRSEDTYQKLKSESGPGGVYILTNAHRRPVLMKMNLRELYHFIRLRDDNHAQWEIRNMAAGLLGELKKRYPFSSLLLCGKSQFASQFESIFHSRPNFLV